MTFAEINRAIDSKQRVQKLEEQRKASYDYILADLIGRSMARVYNSSNKMPSLYEAYPSLFEAKEVEDKINQKRAELSALRFRQFAQFHNRRYEEASNTQ